MSVRRKNLALLKRIGLVSFSCSLVLIHACSQHANEAPNAETADSAAPSQGQNKQGASKKAPAKTDNEKTSDSSNKKDLAQPKSVVITGKTETEVTQIIQSVEELNALFEKYHYTPEDWKAGVREIPRIYLDDVPTAWRKEDANSLPVVEKKRVFFRLLAPIVLYVNERILGARQKVQEIFARFSSTQDITAEDFDWLKDTAGVYAITIESEGELNTEFFESLLMRVDIVPASLALAQGAIESGWGTSRFADEGNSLFGQWSWSGGIKPLEQRAEAHGDHRIAAFDSTGMSVWSYMRNLNTHGAYENFRTRRVSLREQNIPITGKALVSTMTSYSERGEVYVDELKTIMRQNKLAVADNAYLSDMPIIRLVLQAPDSSGASNRNQEAR